MGDKNITPVRIVKTYSAKLKYARTKRTIEKSCSEEDWVVHADVDEFQVYSGGTLKQLLEYCDSTGKTFVRGEFLDRLGANGELSCFDENNPLYIQFPYAGNVTGAITTGWTCKVCAAKAKYAIGDGGNHSLDYGADNVRNVCATMRDPLAYENVVKVHHFKWDSTLPERLNNKLKMEKGDLDSIHGKNFIHEYVNLAKHLRKHNGIVLDELWKIDIGKSPELEF